MNSGLFIVLMSLSILLIWKIRKSSLRSAALAAIQAQENLQHQTQNSTMDSMEKLSTTRSTASFINTAANANQPLKNGGKK